MDVKLLGATNEVTGSRNYICFEDGTEVLVDFGLKQGNMREIKQVHDYNNRKFEFNPKTIDYVVITHAHADHLNLLPLLIKRGFKGSVIATEPTSEFAHITLEDSLKIMNSDIEWYNNSFKRELQPIYDESDVFNTLNIIRCYDFNTEIVLSDTVTLELLVAGHMLGACMPKFTETIKGKQKSIVFTGDTSSFTYQKPFLPPSDELGDVNCIVCESTYGNRTHNKQIDVQQKLEDSIYHTCMKGKTLVVPVFSMQRSSEILWLLREVYLDNPEFYDYPIYLDTPLGIKAQDIMDRNRGFWGEKWLKRDELLGSLFEWDVVQYIREHKDSLLLKNNNPKIILSSSGMCNAGRILFHLDNFLKDNGSKVLLCGYQAQGTTGYDLITRTRNSVSVGGNRVDVRADIDMMPFSSHADYLQLTELVKSSNKDKLTKVILNHGERESQIHFKKHLQQHLSGVRVIIPEYNKCYKI